MIIAKNDVDNRIYTGPEILSQIRDDRYLVSENQLSCPICGGDVNLNRACFHRTGDWFYHTDGSEDCFETESVSDEHRIATEVTVKCLHNQIRQLTGEPVQIDVEKWIGIRENFVIADVRVTYPLKLAAEVYYKAPSLALARRLDTMFSNGYRTFLIFHTDGKYNISRVERHIQQVASLKVGRFHPDTLEVELGDLFTEHQIEMDDRNRSKLPNYIVL